MSIAPSGPPTIRPCRKFIAGEPTKPATNSVAGRSYSSRGVAYCSTRPARMTAMRVASVIASIWSCVTYRMVVPSSRCSRLISIRISVRSLASRLDSGSSNRNTCALRTSARPIATRCRWPPDSAAGLRSSSSRICSRSAAQLTRRSTSTRGVRPTRRPNDRLPRTVIVGYSAYDWNTIAMPRSLGSWPVTSAPPMKMAPLPTSSSPATAESSVDFPQPDGPSSTVNSPGSTSRLMSASTRSEPNDLLTLRMDTPAVIVSPSPRRTRCRARSSGRRRNRPAAAAQRSAGWPPCRRCTPPCPWWC